MNFEAYIVYRLNDYIINGVIWFNFYPYDIVTNDSI